MDLKEEKLSIVEYVAKFDELAFHSFYADWCKFKEMEIHVGLNAEMVQKVDGDEYGPRTYTDAAQWALCFDEWEDRKTKTRNFRNSQRMLWCHLIELVLFQEKKNFGQGLHQKTFNGSGNKNSIGSCNVENSGPQGNKKFRDHNIDKVYKRKIGLQHVSWQTSNSPTMSKVWEASYWQLYGWIATKAAA